MVKGSRFIVTLSPVSDEQSAKQMLAEVRSEMPDATHHCWAWRVGRPTIERAGDDGEPSGSAGRPILSQIVGNDLLDVAAVVTRYFGGTKLGVGGLVRAYGGAVAQALQSAVLVEYRVMTSVQIDYGHTFDRAVVGLLIKTGGQTTGVSYGTGIVREVTVPLDRLAEFRNAMGNLSSGQATVLELE